MPIELHIQNAGSMPPLAFECEMVTRKFRQVNNKKHLIEVIRGCHRERIRKKFCRNVARLLPDAPKGASPEVSFCG
jgi:hypothetical protein